MDVVREQPLTPMGCGRSHPRICSISAFTGDLRARGHHQGTCGYGSSGRRRLPRTYPEDLQGARALLTGLWQEMNRGGIGTIGEICDGKRRTPTRVTSHKPERRELLKAAG